MYLISICILMSYQTTFYEYFFVFIYENIKSQECDIMIQHIL